MDYGKALSYYTKDSKFVSVVAIFSVLLLSCIFIFPILFVGPLMAGYSIALVKRIQNGDYTLPEIDYSGMWQKGLPYAVVVFVIGLVFAIISGVLQAIVSTIFPGTVVRSSSVYYTTSLATTRINSPIATLINFVISTLFSLVQAFISIAMLAIYAKTEQLNSLVKVENYTNFFKKNLTSIIISIVIMFVVGGILGFVGFLLCCVGILPVIVILNFMQAGVTGQLDVSDVK